MAHLKKDEIEIQKAAKSTNPAYNLAYRGFLFFYKALHEVRGEDNMDIIKHLYCGNHKRETFDCIANKLCVSLSRLERKRKEFMHLFSFILESIENDQSGQVA